MAEPEPTTKQENQLLNELEDAMSNPRKSMSKSGKHLYTIIKELRKEILKRPIIRDDDE